MVRTSYECDAPAACVYQMLCRLLGSLIAIGRHAGEPVCQTGTTEEHQGNTHGGQSLKMRIVRRILGQTGYNSLDMHADEVVDGLCLNGKVLMAVGTDNAISFTTCLVLNTVQHSGIVVCHQIGHNDTYHLGGILSQSLGKGVRTVV